MKLQSKQPTILSLRPSSVLVAVLALSALAWAGVPGQQGKLVNAASAKPSATPTLDLLSSEFQNVARVVEPSVVHIEVRKRQGDAEAAPGLREFDLPPGFPEEFRRYFEVPGLRGDDSGNDNGGEFRKFDLAPIVGTGSGWVYDSSGTIITNNHVVQDADSIHVKLFDGTQHEARVVAVDASTDIAVLSIDAKGLSAAALSTEAVRQGDIVFAFGSPLQFEFSMSQGIVAGMGRHTGILGPTGYESFIQTDAAINPGNSGGPLTNIHGEVVGMNTAIVSRSGFFSGMGFAIPAPMIRPVVEQLLASGKVSRGFLGVLIQDDPLLLESFGFEGKGVVIGNVLADGPAARANIREGDIVTAIDGQSIESSTELRQTIAAKRPGSVVRMHLIRNREPLDTKVTLGEIPDSAAGEPTRVGLAPHRTSSDQVLGKLGIERATNLTAQVAEKLEIQDTRGVLVETVRPTSVAAAAGLRSGDVITEVMGQAVTSLEELAKELNRIPPEQVLRLTVRSGGSSHFLVMKIPSDPALQQPE